MSEQHVVETAEMLLRNSNTELAERIAKLEQEKADLVVRVAAYEEAPSDEIELADEINHLSNFAAYNRAKFELREALQSGKFMAVFFRMVPGDKEGEERVGFRMTTWKFPISRIHDALDLFKAQALKVSPLIDTSPLPEAQLPLIEGVKGYD